MSVDDDVSVELGPGELADGGGEPEPREAGSPFVSEDDGTPDAQPETEGGETPEPEPEPDEVTRRLEEKERQAHGLTRALSEERRLRRVAEDRLYQVIERAMAETARAGRGEAVGGEEGGGEPDPETDAAGAILSRIDSLQERLDLEAQERADQEQERTVETVISNVAQFVEHDAAIFTERYPDAPDASRFLRDRMAGAIYSRLKLENPGVAPERLQATTGRILAEDLARMHLEHARNRTSFAASVYAAAQQLGWNGGGAPRRAAADPLANERRRLSTSRSLSNVPGATPRRPPSKREIADMDDDQFDRWLESGVDFRAVARAVAAE